MFIRGHIDIWSCIAARSKSELRWKKKKIGFIKLKLPLFHTWTTNAMKSKDGTQPFRGSFPIHLVKKDNATFTLKIAKPNMTLEGQEVSLTNASLQHAIGDINQKAYNAILKRHRAGEFEEGSPGRAAKIEHDCRFGPLQGLRRPRDCGDQSFREGPWELDTAAFAACRRHPAKSNWQCQYDSLFTALTNGGLCGCARLIADQEKIAILSRGSTARGAIVAVFRSTNCHSVNAKAFLIKVRPRAEGLCNAARTLPVRFRRSQDEIRRCRSKEGN